MENREAKENELVNEKEEEETSREENEEEEETAKVMKPWEQHAGVISMPRYDYKAPSALLSRSHPGFLITCSIKREKSATKESLQFLHKYAGLFSTGNSSYSNSQSDQDDAVTKRRKTDTDENGNSHSLEDGGLNLSLVKLNRSGLVLLTFPGDLASSQITINVLSEICDSLQCGILKSPLWCHRIFPIQATCQLNEKELQAVVSQLVHQFMKDNENKLPSPIKFAIGYNRRGIEEQMKKPKDPPKDLDILDRSKCFEIVASSVKAVVPDSVVDLKNPDLSVLVELLPLYGVPSERSIGAVSVLPRSLVSTKPRLCIRPLVSELARKSGQAKSDSQSQNSAN